MPDEVFLLDDREVVITRSWQVHCDGDGILGHPREFITLEPRGEAVCKYCGRRFLHVSTPAAEEARRSVQPVAPPLASAGGR